MFTFKAKRKDIEIFVNKDCYSFKVNLYPDDDYSIIECYLAYESSSPGGFDEIQLPTENIPSFVISRMEEELYAPPYTTRGDND